MARRSAGPPHGWRALYWEIGVVVVGVLLALAAQQLVDGMYWEGQAAKARYSIEEELLEHERDAYERQAVTPCLKQQLRLLAARLETTRGSWTATPMVVYPSGVATVADKVTPTAYRAPTRLWIDEAYKTAQSTGALNHLPDALVAQYAGIYRRSRRSIEIQDIEEAAANELSVLAVDGLISRDMRSRLFAALARVDYASSYMETSLESEIEMLAKVLDRVPVERRRKSVEEAVASQRQFRGTCVQLPKLRF
jgi:hypothetical protein